MKFNQNLNSWNTASLANIQGMFSFNTVFNGAIDAWDVSNVTDMSIMFLDANSFDQPIGAWDTSNVVDMSQMFYAANSFNQNIGSWDTSSVIESGMSYMFTGAESFNNGQILLAGEEVIIPNAPLLWDTSKTTDLQYMFNDAQSFNQDISTWNVSNVTNMQNMFDGADVFNQPIGTWDVSNVTSTARMFDGAGDFNNGEAAGASTAPLIWDTTNITDMYRMFRSARKFNQPIGTWDVSNVTDMNGMFAAASQFDQPIGTWDVSNVTDMNGMFFSAWAFNQPIGSWDVSNVTDLSGMFVSAFNFNQNISAWNTANVTDLSGMFDSASDFNNGEAAGASTAPMIWDTSSVIDMSMMFNSAGRFNQPIGSWDVSNVTDMSSMFRNIVTTSPVFNQDISTWLTSSVANMDNMFENARAFNQDLSGWAVPLILAEPFNFDTNAINWNTASLPIWGTWGEYIPTSPYHYPMPSSITTDPTNPDWRINHAPAGYIFAAGLGFYANEPITNASAMFKSSLTTTDHSDTASGSWGYAFGDNGMNFYVMDGSDIYHYTSTVPWSMGSVTYTGNVYTSDAGYIEDAFVKPDGTAIFLLDDNGDLYTYAMSTPYDISTATLLNMTSFLAGGGSTYGGGWSHDGTKFFIIDQDTNEVHSYSLSTAWDFSTATLVTSVPSSLDGTTVSDEGVAFSFDGALLFDGSGNYWTLSDSFNLSTAVYVNQVTLGTDPVSPYIDTTGMYIITGDNSDDIFQLAMLNIANDLSSITITASAELLPASIIEMRDWDTSTIANMDYMFSGQVFFAENLTSWDVSLIPSEPTNFAAGTDAWNPADQPIWGTTGI